MLTQSETLLNEILGMLQTVIQKQEEIENSLIKMNARLDRLVKDAFVNEDLKGHREWHRKEENRPIWKRLLGWA